MCNEFCFNGNFFELTAACSPNVPGRWQSPMQVRSKGRGNRVISSATKFSKTFLQRCCNHFLTHENTSAGCGLAPPYYKLVFSNFITAIYSGAKYQSLFSSGILCNYNYYMQLFHNCSRVGALVGLSLQNRAPTP